MLSRALAVALLALLLELLAARWRGRNASFNESIRTLVLLLVCCFLLLLMGKGAAEEKLAAKVHQELLEKLEDSFKGGQSAVKGVWIRTGIATAVGFGLTVAPPPSMTATADAIPDKERPGGQTAGATTARGAAAGVTSNVEADNLLVVRRRGVLSCGGSDSGETTADAEHVWLTVLCAVCFMHA